MSKKAAAPRKPAARPAPKAAAKPSPSPADDQDAIVDQRPVVDEQRDPNNGAVHINPPAANPAPNPGQTSVNQPARPAVSSLQRDLEQTRTAESLRDRAEGKVDSKTDESAGERRAARANVLAGLPATGKRIKVRATQAGYYDHARRRPGDVFTIDGALLEEDVLQGKKVVRKKGDVAAFSKRWMERVDDDEREHISTGADALREQNQELLAARRRGEALPVPGAGPDDNPLGD